MTRHEIAELEDILSRGLLPDRTYLASGLLVADVPDPETSHVRGRRRIRPVV